MRESTDSLRRIIVSDTETGSLTLSFVCPHCAVSVRLKISSGGSQKSTEGSETIRVSESGGVRRVVDSTIGGRQKRR